MSVQFMEIDIGMDTSYR